MLEADSLLHIFHFHFIFFHSIKEIVILHNNTEESKPTDLKHYYNKVPLVNISQCNN